MAAPAAATLTLADALKGAAKFFAKTNAEMVFDPSRQVECLPSGCLVFDLVSGGGWPKSRLSEVFGMEHSGKTALVHATCAGVQRAGGVAVLVDAEYAFHPGFARRAHGLVHDGETFAVFQPDNIEQVDQLYSNFLAKLGRIDFLAFDSVDAMKPQGLIEGALEDEKRVGIHAIKVSQFVAKMKAYAKTRGIPVVFTNQMRSIISTGRPVDQNVGTGAGFNTHEKYTTSGGLALRYYASLRMKLEFAKRIEDEMGVDPITGEQAKARTGNLIRCINIKNKIATPFLKGAATFHFAAPEQKPGWANDHDVMELLRHRGRLVQTGGRGPKLTYRGLAIPSWEHAGSKVENERRFLGSPELIADARQLLQALVREADGAEALFERAAPGQDFSAGETEGQDGLDQITLAKLGIAADLDDLPPSRLAVAAPISEMTL